MLIDSPHSLWDFTNVVMNYLLLGKRYNGIAVGDHPSVRDHASADEPCPVLERSGQSRSLEWLRYFDVVVVGCGKPAFFQVSILDSSTNFDSDLIPPHKPLSLLLSPQGSGSAIQRRRPDGSPQEH